MSRGGKVFCIHLLVPRILHNEKDGACGWWIKSGRIASVAKLRRVEAVKISRPERGS
jgi:hypothetical protein